jgi:hypothetical protein
MIRESEDRSAAVLRRLPPAQAKTQFLSLFEARPRPRAVLRRVDATGEQARPCLEPAEPPKGDGEVLVIQAARKQSERGRRRAKSSELPANGGARGARCFPLSPNANHNRAGSDRRR